jgi:hypothetical protein
MPNVNDHGQESAWTPSLLKRVLSAIDDERACSAAIRGADEYQGMSSLRARDALTEAYGAWFETDNATNGQYTAEIVMLSGLTQALALVEIATALSKLQQNQGRHRKARAKR